MKRAPEQLIFRGNFATAAYRIEAGLRVLNEMPLQDVSWIRHNHEYAFVTYARLLAKAKIAGLPSHRADRFNLIAEAA